MTNLTQWKDMDSGKQTHKEKIKLNGSQSTDYVGLTHFSMGRKEAHGSIVEIKHGMRLMDSKLEKRTDIEL